MDNKETFTFNGSTALDKAREDYRFFETVIDVDEQKLFFPVTVGDVRVKVENVQADDRNENTIYHLTANCFSEIQGDYTLDYIISKKEYLDFLNTHKKGSFRLDMFLKYSKEDLRIRKMGKSKHIDVRMTEELFNQICKDADSCKMEPSSYIRDIVKGKRPRKALTEEEFSIMQDFVAVYRNYENFFNATKGVMQGMTPEQKLNYIIEGHAYSWWRKFLIAGLPVMQRLINGARMNQNIVWKDAQGKQLPKYDREVIALIPHGTEEYKAVFAHRPNPKRWDEKSIIDGTIQHHTPVTYGIGKWNLPNVAYWLDVAIPKQNKKED